jgi:acyl carrier protein
MIGKFLSFIAEVMEVDPLELRDEDARFEAFEKWDSQREVELGVMLEHEYAITLNDDEMRRLRSVREVRTVLHAHAITDT